MKKHYQLIFISFLFFAVATKGQPILTNANTSFQIGEIYEQISVDYVPEGSAGADVIWDFSNLNSLDTNLIAGIDPSTFPSIAAFPNATVYLSDPQSIYTYFYHTTDTSLEQLGYATSNYPIVYQNSKIILTYPFTFNSTSTDYFTGYNNAGGNYFIVYGSDSISADAYGTITLPSGTYDNVLRVKIKENSGVEIDGMEIDNTSTISYYWYKPGEHFPIFISWSTVLNEGNPSYFSTYLKSTTIGLKDFNINKSFSISPNPTQSNANIIYELTNAATVNISLVNGIGQIVEEEIFPSQTNGKYSFTFDMTKYSKGLYTVNLKIDNQLISKKLVVE